MRLKQLEITLQRLEGFPRPRVALEQYQTPAPLAARLLFHALMKGDIEGKSVYDLGCGTGILAIGAALLGAAKVTGIEIDKSVADIAGANAVLTGVNVEFIVADVGDAALPIRISTCDTVIMNPPFGAQQEHADRPFIDLALKTAPVTYGIFNAGSAQFIKTYTEGRAEISEKVGGVFTIQRTFSFHTKERKDIGVEILRLISNQIQSPRA